MSAYPIRATLRQLAKHAGKPDSTAITQDILDTASVLKMCAVLGLISTDIEALQVTFGYKVAIWVSFINRHAERLEQRRPRMLVARFAGAAGTLASLGKDGSRYKQPSASN